MSKRYATKLVKFPHNKTYTYEPSNERFVIRTKGKSLTELYQEDKKLNHFNSSLQLIDAFPDVNVYVLKLLNSALTVGEMKVLFNSSAHVIFAGTLFELAHSKIFQIYSENLYIEFYDDVDAHAAELLCKKYQLDSYALEFTKSGFFAKPRYQPGALIFDIAEAIQEESQVYSCQPELITGKYSLEHQPFINHCKAEDDCWWKEIIRLEQAWKASLGKGVKIAIIDDGIEMTHPGFASRIFKPYNLFGSISNDANHQFKTEGHGTACASVAAANWGSIRGVAPEAGIIPIRSKSLGSIKEAIAINYAVTAGADIISCSWGPNDLDRSSDLVPMPLFTAKAIEHAVKFGRNGKGAVVLFAAGNNRQDLHREAYASHPDVIAVGAVNKEGKRSSFSNHGNLFCLFPGGDFKPEKHGLAVLDRIGEQGYSKEGVYPTFSGTSAACPGVAGVIALMLSIKPELSLNTIKHIIKNASKKIIGENAGIVDACEAIRLTMNTKTKRLTNMETKGYSLHIGINQVDQSYYHDLIPDLDGCINDMLAMKNFAAKVGFQSNITLENSSATMARIKAEIRRAAGVAQPGDIFLLTYSGHGTQVEDFNDDEKEDGLDEAWVTYNGLLIDDELDEAFKDFQAGVRVLVVLDSCHSRTATKAIKIPNTNRQAAGAKYRFIAPSTINRVITLNNETEIFRNRAKNAFKGSPKASIKTLAACQDFELAQEVNGEGLFTKTLLRVLENFEQGNYATLINKVAETITSAQQPDLVNSGTPDQAFDQQFPFQIGQKPWKYKPAAKLSESEISPAKAHQIDAEYILLDKVDKKNGQIKIVDQSIPNNQLAGTTAWDKAYNLFLADPKLGYLEPDKVSEIYFDESFAGDENMKGSKEEPAGYLWTYPFPDETYPEKFLWHLDDQHSQLLTARARVFPEMEMGLTPKGEMVRIGHIDTGVLLSHPSLPRNFNKELSHAFKFGRRMENVNDTDLRFSIAEQQGHGHATISILAGDEVPDFKGRKRFFGAIPFADVISLKISESVVLLSGKNFSDALRYAVDNGCVVVSMSMAGLPSRTMAKAVNYAYEHGVLLVAANGNSWVKNVKKIAPKTTLFPARYERVVGVAGATWERDLPYLYRKHNKKSRTAGGLYMQMNYGPTKVLKGTIAAYTPNIPWMGESIEGKLYSKSGGGTSSATPQVAAAVALYYQYYKDEIESIAKNEKWKRAELLRRALFQSARKIHLQYYGQGVLRANEMLNIKPSSLVNGLEKAQEAKAPKGIFDSILASFGLRNIKQEPNVLKEMMTSEILQLMHTEASLFEFLDKLPMDDSEVQEKEEFDLVELVKRLKQCEHASDTLKRSLKAFKEPTKVNPAAAQRAIFNITSEPNPSDIGGSYLISTTAGPLELSTIHNALAIQTVETEFEDVDDDEFEEANVFTEIHINVAPQKARSAISDELHIVPQQDKYADVALYVESYIEGQEEPIGEWLYAELQEESSKTKSASSQHYNCFVVPLSKHAKARGIIGKVIRFTIKVFRLDKLFRWTHKIKYLDLTQPRPLTKRDIKNRWKRLKPDNAAVWKAIMDQKRNLIVFPGFLSKIEGGYQDLFLEEENFKALKERYGQYILGFNMDSILTSVDDNAKEFLKELPANVHLKNCDVMARSRGTLVARQLFENTIQTAANQKKYKIDVKHMVMIAGPHQGTPIADAKHHKAVLNVVSALVSIVPVAPVILQIIKFSIQNVTELKGFHDQIEDSVFMQKFALNTPVPNATYFGFSSNFEPEDELMNKLDQAVIDRKVFKEAHNDMITPVLGAFKRNPNVAGYDEDNAFFKDGNICILTEADRVNHFEYLNKQKVITQLWKWIPKS